MHIRAHFKVEAAELVECSQRVAPERKKALALDDFSAYLTSTGGGRGLS